MRNALMALALMMASASVSAETENKWRLEFSGNAESAGHITLALAPEGEPAVMVTTTIADDTAENEVAAAVAQQMRLQVGAAYEVERDDGEDVLIKRRGGEKRFSVGLVENTVEGVRFNLDQE